MSFYYLKKRDFKLSVFWYVLAGLFHSASWIFAFIYIIDRMSFKKKYLYFLLIASTIASFIIDPYYLFRVASGQGSELIGSRGQGGEMLEYYSSYSSYLVGSQLPFLRLVLYTLPYVFIAFLILNKMGDLKKKKDVYVKIFIWGVIINNLVIANPIGFRLMKASLLLAMLLIPVTFDMYNNKKTLYWGYSCFLLLLYSYNVFSRTLVPIENDIVPYQLNPLLW
jgi:hypothetical protein